MNFEKFERFISNAFCNVGQSFYDSYVEANVRFRSSLGMKNVIIRRQLGNCCDWCAKLAGIYDSSDMPDNIRENIYKRHNNCRCLVTYKNDKGYQNVWTKKIYQTQRESRIKRLKEIDYDNLNYKRFTLERRRLKSEGKNIYDSTNEWEKMAKPETATIINNNYINLDGVKYICDDKHVIMDLTDREKRILNEFTNKYGGRMMYVPRINFPQKISTPDGLYNGMRIDIKSIGLRHPGIVGDNLLYRAIEDQEQQAKCFIFDIELSGLTKKDAIKQAELLFYRKGSKYIEKAFLYDGKDFFKIYERI